MMEFLIYLSPIGKEIVHDLIAAKFNVRENIGYCSNTNNYGYTQSNKNFVICTKNIKNGTRDLEGQILQTISHESTHAAQVCKGNIPIGIPWNKMILSRERQEDVKRSLDTFNNSINSKFYRMEYEAYWMQENPEMVNSYVKKLCLNK